MSNRVIKFRGLHGLKWVYGSLIRKLNPHKVEDETWCYLIHDGALSAVEVTPESVGQFTGLLDKNRKEIYEGDVIEVENDGSDQICTVEWNTGQWLLMDNLGGSWTRQLYHQPHRLKILGNIYENPDLLKPQQE